MLTNADCGSGRIYIEETWTDLVARNLYKISELGKLDIQFYIGKIIH